MDRLHQSHRPSEITPEDENSEEASPTMDDSWTANQKTFHSVSISQNQSNLAAEQTTQTPTNASVLELVFKPSLQLSNGGASDTLTSLTYRSQLLERLPLDSTVLHCVKSPGAAYLDINIMTHRRSSLDFSFYSAWITRAMEICAGFQPPALTALSTWTRLGPNGLELCPQPPKINVPRIVLGHLFAEEVFGGEDEIPLYYIQIIQGNSDGVKALISSSKQEVIDSAYAEAYAGYSTMFIGAICQGARTRLLDLCSSPASHLPWKPNWFYMSPTSAQEALSMVEKEPMQVALIY